MIEDKELRDLFKAEGAEHVQRLNDGLLRLEKNPKDSATLEEVFREAHSLKGAARMVGVVDVEIISHKLEDILGVVKKGEMALSPEIVDSMLKALDTIRKLVHEAVTGEPSGVKVSEESVYSLSLTPDSKLKSSEFRIETVRVDTKMLDALMTQTGELTVTKGHISSRIPEIGEIIEIVEELNKATTNSNPPSPPFNKGGNWGDLQSKIQKPKSAGIVQGLILSQTGLMTVSERSD